MHTRASNSEKRPGQVVLDSMQKRRPAAEVAAEKAAQAAQQQQDEDEHDTAVTHLKTTHRQAKKVQNLPITLGKGISSHEHHT